MSVSGSDIYEACGEYLSGRKLDVGRRFHDPSNPVIVERIAYLRQRCIGKKVLHVGCLDHPEIALEKANKGTWLHGIVSEVSASCVGIDIDLRGYELVRSKLSLDNIRLLDLTKPLAAEEVGRLRAVEWDLILCPEVLEHVTNHQTFLENLYRISRPGTTLVVTAPNAFRFENFVNTLRGYESINSDHKYWFTFYTLSSLLAAHGWRPCRLIYYDGPNAKKKLWRRFIADFAKRISRPFSDGIIIEATRYEDKALIKT
jgi:2-polyprenyl-3-methyl-5-hydroxy-6-metoxy-1,4-benzoquinol methylase